MSEEKKISNQDNNESTETKVDSKDKSTTGAKRKGKRINKKPSKVVAIIVAVIVALFVAVAAIVAWVLMYDVENPNVEVISNYFSTNASGQYIATNTLGQEIVVEPKEQVNVLVLGKDRASFNTDVMILVSYNISDGAITMMQIPRDTYLELFNGAGYSNHKANSLLSKFYNRALRNGTKDPMKEALENLTNGLSEVFGFPINYYVMVELDGFVDIIDGIGGVEVDVPFRMYYKDPAQNLYIDLQPGKQVLNGDQAEDFIRFRADYVEGDIGRVDAQKIFISACIAQIKNDFSVSTVSTIVEEVFEHVVTNVSIQDMIAYAKSALSIDLSKMSMLTIPGIQVRQYGNSGTWYYVVSRKGTIDAVNKYFFPFNIELDESKFDANGNLYDKDGTYLYTVYHTEYAEESYSANGMDDIYIYNYNGGGGTTSKPSKNPPPISATTTTSSTTKKTTSSTTKTTKKTTIKTSKPAPIDDPDPVVTTEVEVTQTAEVTSTVETPENTDIIENTDVVDTTVESAISDEHTEDVVDTSPEVTDIIVVTTVPIETTAAEVSHVDTAAESIAPIETDTTLIVEPAA